MLVALAGCGGLEPVAPYAPVTDPALLYMTLKLDHQAVNLSTAAPHNTLQLTATPRDALGAPMTGLPAPTFRSLDTTRVWVTPEGLLQARRQASEVRVIAEIVAEGNVRHADTVRVNVTTNANPPQMVSFALDPVPPRGMPAAVTIGDFYLVVAHALFGAPDDPFPRLTTRANDASGAEIPGLAIHYESLDPGIVWISESRGEVHPIAVGEAKVVAHTTAYGVTRADTASLTITLPVIQTIQILAGPDSLPAFDPKTVTLRAGGLVFWFNASEQAADVTFDDPTNVAEAPVEICAVAGFFGGDPEAACGTGNIPAIEDTDNEFADTRVRRFPMVGTYSYRTGTGATGRIVVVP